MSFAQNAPWRAEATLNVGETFSDNVGLVGSGGKQSDWVTEITPGLKITGRGARANGDVNLRLQNFVSASHSENNRSSVGLAASGSLELIERRFFIDSSASINRQEISAFGAPAGQTGGYSASSNITEVRTVSIAPRAHFNVSPNVVVDLRYRANLSDTDAAVLGYNHKHDWSADIGNDAAAAGLGWNLSANATSTDSTNSQSVSSKTFKGGLNYSFSSELRGQVFAGRESNDFRGDRNESSTIWGGGFDWVPGPRTRLGVTVSDRFFGTGYSVSFTHRMRLSAIQLSVSRDVQSTTADGVSGIYQIAATPQYQLEDARLQATISDPQLRHLQVMQNLAAQGITPFSVSQLNFLSSGYTVNRRVSAGWVYSGARNSVSVTLASNRRDRTDNTSLQGQGDFSTFSRITDRSLTTSVRHSLSASSTVGLSFSHTDTKGTGGIEADASRVVNGLGLTFSTKLGPQTTGQLAYHRTRSTGSTSTRENAISAAMAHRF